MYVLWLSRLIIDILYSGKFLKGQIFEKTSVTMNSKKYFRKHLDQRDFENIFSKILKSIRAS